MTRAATLRGTARALVRGDSFILYSAQRVVQALPSVLVVVTIGFLLLNLAPGDPVNYLVGDIADKGLVEMIRARLGLDQPLHVRYWTYITNVLQGQLGRSFIFGRPVSDLILSRVGPTLLLFFTQFIISTLIGVTLGALAAYKKGSVLDKAVITLSIWWYSIPVFWSGQLLLLLFAVNLRWLPSYGMRSIVAPEGGELVDLIRHLILPATTLALLNMALIARMARSSMVEALQQDYILTARAKGVSERLIVARHALRNALLPVVTILGLDLGRTLSGSVLVETVFSWPGIGRLMYDSIATRDYPVVLGLFIVTSTVVVLANLIADITYAFLDPRIRYR